MEFIDFDSYFSDYLTAWAQENGHRFKRPEDMEDEVPDVYLQFLATPADWLDGATPGAYFDRFSDVAELCRLLCDYAKSDIPVPDPLLDRLLTLEDEDAILILVRDENAPSEARMHGIELLRHLESTAPMVDYIRWQVEQNQDEELMDNALESLKDMGSVVHGSAKIAFLAADVEGKEALLDVLCEFPSDDDVFSFTLQGFENSKDKRGLYASYLAKLDDDRALEALLNAAESEDIDYVDFIEIRSAIERLGSEAPVRDFSNDPTFQAVQRLQ